MPDEPSDAATEVLTPGSHTRDRQPALRTFLLATIAALAGLWFFAALTLIDFRWIDPPTTAVHVQRRIQSWFGNTRSDTPGTRSYSAHYDFVPLNRISPDLQHAVIAAEDARFYQHHGFDWQAMEIAAQDDINADLDTTKTHHRLRGGSTLTQQLVKNLFFGTGRTLIRKGAETTLVPIAEVFLGKQRILELYLNVVEWGPGIYGAEAASHYYFHTSARNLNRRQSAELAAILPAPRTRRPDHMTHYSALIQERMRQMGW